ncbi:MAG: riboflavin synthase [bacterium]
MFTGIIEDLGKVESLIRYRDRAVITISTKFLSDLRTSDSVCVNGACLTVAEKVKSSFKADIIKETLEVTSLTYLKVGDYVNLERAVSASGRFNGHIVQGHVDCRSMIINIVSRGSAKEMEINLPERFRKYVTEKGSISVDGVSLTVAHLSGTSFKVAIIPHTALNTNLFHKKIGDYLNLEFDMLAKYLESLIKTGNLDSLVTLKDMRIDENFLQKAGFLN